MTGAWVWDQRHTPAYDFNDHNIAAGSAYWIALVNELLSPTPL